MLVLKNVTYTFAGAIAPLFKDISCTIQNPGITLVTGKNGVGKSTLFSLVQGTVAAHGTIMLDDQSYDLNMLHDRIQLQAHTILMQQKVDHMLAPSFTVRENLQAASLSKFPFLTDFSRTVYTMHGHDLHFLDIPVARLSGGQKQIVALLMSIQKKPSVLLLDEPTAALDEKNAQIFMDFVHDLAIAQNMIVLCITHDSMLIDRFKGNGIVHLEAQEESTNIYCK